jgi:hypothetical protein
MANSGIPFVVVALVATGAYFLGRQDAKRSSTADVPVPPPDAPRPPIPEAAAPPPQLGADYADEWDAALERYEVEVYPPEAEPYIDRLLPPPRPDGISVSPDCQTIAVGEDWWDIAAQYARSQSDRPADSVATYIMRYLAPTCVNRNTAGAAGLRQALVDWLRLHNLVRNPRLTEG